MIPPIRPQIEMKPNADDLEKINLKIARIYSLTLFRRRDNYELSSTTFLFITF